MKKILGTVIAVLVVGALASAGFVYSGIYDIGADDPHWGTTYFVFETLRVRSVAARAKEIHVPPDLQSAERIRRGAGNYDAMCATCHLSSSVQESELHAGLYPQPPSLAKSATIDPPQAFWVIKHGIKASGMPAWGKSMDDTAIWDMVAFLKKLPTLTPEQYAAEVGASEGHSHGKEDMSSSGHGESVGHGHAQGPAGSASHDGPGPQAAPEHRHAQADRPRSPEPVGNASRSQRPPQKDHHHAPGTKPH